MHDEQTVMKVETVLPEDFDGVFRFTNWTDQEFVGKWNNKEYHFPANSTSPMIIPDHSPLQIQQIRKKFAKDLAEREFYKSQRYEAMRKIEGERDEFTGMIKPNLSSSLNANSYSLDDLTPFIQKCLIPLEIKRAPVTEAPKLNMEEILTRDPKNNNLNTAPAADDKDLENLARGNVSLKQKAGI